MPSTPLPSRQHHVVLVDDVGARARVALLDRRWAELGDLAAAHGLTAVWKIAAPRWVSDEEVWHLVRPVGDESLPVEGWVDLSEPDRLGVAVGPEAAAWVRAAYDAWRSDATEGTGTPWWSRSWPGLVASWVDEVLPGGTERVGEPQPVRLWSLSAVLRVPVRRADVDRDLWFKATCERFRSEPAVTAVVADLAPQLAPDLAALDLDHAWMLLEEIHGADDDLPELGPAVAAAMAELQIQSSSRLGQLRAAGFGERSLLATADGFADVLADSVVRDRFPQERWALWATLVPWVREKAVALDRIGLPLALNHADLHLGNVAGGGGEGAPVVFDWTDACLTHPYLDARHLVDSVAAGGDPALVEATWEAWSRPWREHHPELDHDAAWRLVPAVELAFQVVSYEQIFRAQDQVARGELLSAVPWMLDRLEALRASETDQV